MPDNRNTIEIVSITDSPLISRNSYSQGSNYEASNYGAKAVGDQGRFARLRDWRRIIYRHRWMILSIVLVAVSFAIVQAYRVKPIYQATTIIDISPEASSLSKAGQVLLSGSTDNTKAETLIIKTLPVPKKTSLSLNLDKNPHFLDVSATSPVSTDAGANETEPAKPGNDKSRADPTEMLASARAERVKLAPYIQELLDNLKVEGV